MKTVRKLFFSFHFIYFKFDNSKCIFFIIFQFDIIFNNHKNNIGGVNGIEVVVELFSNGEPFIDFHQNSSYSVEHFIDDLIDYHNRLENEFPVKNVVILFWYTKNVTVVKRTVDLFERKENEVKITKSRFPSKFN